MRYKCLKYKVGDLVQPVKQYSLTTYPQICVVIKTHLSLENLDSGYIDDSEYNHIYCQIDGTYRNFIDDELELIL